MSQNLYGVWDDVAEDYLAVFVLPADGAAVRCFRSACLDRASVISKDPACYSLRRIASFDAGNGSLLPLTPPVRVSRALDHIPPPMPEPSVSDRPFSPFPEPEKGGELKGE